MDHLFWGGCRIHTPFLHPLLDRSELTHHLTRNKEDPLKLFLSLPLLFPWSGVAGVGEGYKQRVYDFIIKAL